MVRVKNNNTVGAALMNDWVVEPHLTLVIQPGEVKTLSFDLYQRFEKQISSHPDLEVLQNVNDTAEPAKEDETVEKINDTAEGQNKPVLEKINDTPEAAKPADLSEVTAKKGGKKSAPKEQINE